MKITLSTKMIFFPFLLILLLNKTKLYEKKNKKKKNIFIYKFLYEVIFIRNKILYSIKYIL